MWEKFDAEAFAQNWIRDWNAHDLDAIMDHYDESIVFRSPLIAKILGDPSGEIRGRERLRSYFAKGLALYRRCMPPSNRITSPVRYVDSIKAKTVCAISSGLAPRPMGASRLHC